MDLCHAVDAVSADNRKACHVNNAVLNDRKRAHLVLIAGITAAYFLKMTAVDFIDDHIDARKQRLEHLNAPRLECLRHDCVVRIRNRVARDRPCVLPRQRLLVDENAHELRYAERGVRIVDVDADLSAEIVDPHPVLLVVADNALHACRYEEVLLNEAHAAPFERAVIRIEVARNRLDKAAVVIALLNFLLRQQPIVGKVAIDLSVPHAQRIDRRIVIADNRHIIRHRHDDHRILMNKLEPPPRIAHIGIAAEFDIHRLIRLAVFPCKAVAQPVVRNLNLVVADDLLLEKSVLIADRASVSGQAVCCERVDEARRKTAEAAVAEPRIRLHLIGIGEVQIKVLEHILQRFFDAEIDEVGFQESAQQELNGKVVDLLLLALRILPVCLDPVVRDGLLGRCRDRLVDLNLRQIFYFAPKHDMRRRYEAAPQDLLHCLKGFPCRPHDLILLCQIVHSFSKRSPGRNFLHTAAIPMEVKKQEAVSSSRPCGWTV